MKYYNQYGMKSRYTQAFEVDEVVAVDYDEQTRLGTITKIWKNGVVVVAVEPDWVVNDDGQLLARIPGANPRERRFNPDGHGRGDDRWFQLNKFNQDDVTADHIRRNLGRFLWGRLRAEAIEENIRRDNAAMADVEANAAYEHAQKVNAENFKNRQSMEVSMNGETFPVSIMKITTKRNREMMIFVVMEEHDDPYPSAVGHYEREATAVVGRLEHDRVGRRAIPWFQSDNSWRTSGIGVGDARAELWRDIIYRYWDW